MLRPAAGGLTNPEIATCLVIDLETVKSRPSRLVDYPTLDALAGIAVLAEQGVTLQGRPGLLRPRLLPSAAGQ